MNIKKIKYKVITFLEIVVFMLILTFIATNFIILIMKYLKKYLDLSQISFVQLSVILINTLILFCIIFIPFFVVKKTKKTKKVNKIFEKLKTNKEKIGLKGLMTWRDIGLVFFGILIYFILRTILISIAVKIFPNFDLYQEQDLGFKLNSSMTNYQYFLSFFTIVIFVPIFEEIIFRGYLFSKLKDNYSSFFSIVITSLIFGLMHGAWNVGIDTFAMSVAMCINKNITKTIYSGILIHIIKNGLAFYIIMNIM